MRDKNRLSLIIGYLTVTIFLLVVMVSDGYAFVPQKINYQGTLSDSGGTPVNGSVTMVFSIYNVASGGAALWTETQSVSVNNGIYNVNLGNVNPINLPFDTQYYLGVRVGSDGEMTPRQTLTSVGYAFRAIDADSALNLSCTNCISQGQLNFTPGTITGVTPGTGLVGGGTSGTVTLNVDTTALQSRVSSSCASGSAIRTINADGTVICQSDTNSGGTVTSVGTGAGLIGGPITTSGTINVNFAGMGSATTVARSDHNHDGVYQKRYGKVAVVAQSGGDYTDPVTAMNQYSSWCGTPSSTNPCLLKIMPGVYNVGSNSIIMQRYIDIEGSGENVTVISGNNGYPSGVVIGRYFAELRFLTVQNTSSSGNGTAILNSVEAPKITNVTIKSNCSNSTCYGIFNEYGDPKLTDVTVNVEASNGDCYGVFNMSGTGVPRSPIMTNVTVRAIGYNAGYSAYGVRNEGNDCSPTMTNVTVTASGLATKYGVFNSASAFTTMTNVTVTISGSNSYGLYNLFGTVNIDHSVIKGSTYTIHNHSGATTNVGSTKLDGGAVDNYGTLKCIGAYDENYAPLNSSCQ